MAYRDEFARADGGKPDAMDGKAPSPAVPPPHDALAKPQQPTAETAKPETKAKSKSKFGKKPIIFAVIAAGFAFGAYEGANWWQTGRFMVETDDAYVQADITFLSAKVSGYVATVGVVSNQSVKAGDLIAKIDDGDYRLAVQAAKDKLATQESAIERIGRQIDAGKASAAQAEAQIAAVQADAEKAMLDYGRQMQLSQSNYTSRATLEGAKADRDRSQANVKSAEAALSAAQANVEVLSAQRNEATRVAAELKTAVEKAQRDLSFTEIRAPVDGVIGNKAVEVGTYVQPGARLGALVPLSTVHVDANFKETQLSSLHPGQKVHIEVDAYPDHDVIGTLESVSPASGAVFSLLPPENATGNFTKIVQRVPVRVAVNPNTTQQGFLRPGLSVVVKVDTRESAPAATKTAQH